MAVYMGRTVALCGNSSMYALHEQSMEHGMEIGLKQSQLKKGLKTGITISIMPTLPVLLVLFSLTPLLGIPLPWLRLSVIGSAYYETYAATTALSCLGETFQTTGTARMDGSRPCG